MILAQSKEAGRLFTWCLATTPEQWLVGVALLRGRTATGKDVWHCSLHMLCIVFSFARNLIDTGLKESD